VKGSWFKPVDPDQVETFPLVNSLAVPGEAVFSAPYLGTDLKVRQPGFFKEFPLQAGFRRLAGLKAPTRRYPKAPA
jgi:hypothetical protein